MTITALLDEETSVYSQGYQLNRIYKIEIGVDAKKYKVRVRVKRDSYDIQSYAVAEVFNENSTWTEIVSEAPFNWYLDTKYIASGTTRGMPRHEIVIQVSDQLDRIAERLITRAHTVLS
jgi:hypothetical protein